MLPFPTLTQGITRMLLALTLLGCTQLMAEERPLVLDPITVVASKRPVPLSEVAGQISVITAGDIRTSMSGTLDDVLRYEPGVDVTTDGSRFGSESITLRGIGGNRVAIEVDGVPVRNGFAIGSYANAGRTMVETDRIKRLEILYGPASTLYGSDALGGVLAFTTWNPADLVGRTNGNRYASLNGTTDSADQSFALSGQAALLQGPHGLLFSVTARDGHELDSAAVDDEALDPQDWSTRDYALRYTYTSNYGDQFRIGVDHFERQTRTDVQSLLGYGRFARTTLLLGDDMDKRQQFLADYSFGRSWLDSGVVRAFLVNNQTHQNTIEERAPPPAPTRATRDFDLDTRQWGLEFTGLSERSWGSTDHAISTGIELLVTDLEQLRDGFEENLITGEISDMLLGETLPTRDFPNSTTRELGVFLQDEISLGTGRWTLTPALRFEHYELDPQPDPIYAGAFPDAELVSLSEQGLTPRLALRYALNDNWSVYGQYAEGFRAPPVEDVNIGFELPRLRFRAIPNPDLDSETSQGYELGLRYFSAGNSLSLTWFDTRFEDLIESRARIGIDPASGFLEFQSRNIDQARIRGVDLRFEQGLEALNDALDGWVFSLAAMWSRGDNESNGQPLNTISPPQAVTRLSWESANSAFSATFSTIFTARQDRVDSTDGERFETPSSIVLDLTTLWQFHPSVSLSAGIFNLTDQTYWRWQDVGRLDPTDPMIPLLAMPGRSVRISLSFATGSL